jgi:hypothetical protein
MPQTTKPVVAPDGDELLSSTEAAALLGYSSGYFGMQVRRGNFPTADHAVGQQKRQRFWKRSTIEAYIRERGDAEGA